MLSITNNERCCVRVDFWCKEIEGDNNLYWGCVSSPSLTLRPNSSGRALVEVPVPYGELATHANRRWRLRCHKERLTFSEQAKHIVASWPCVGSLVLDRPMDFETQLFAP